MTNSPLGRSARPLISIAVSLVALALGLAASTVSAAAAGYPDPLRVSGDITVHDPTMVKAANGTYIVASTGTNLELRTSTDRVNWRRAGVVWPNGAPWTDQFTGGTNVLWAPDLSFHNGRYYLYYSASSFGSQNSGIFLATSPTAAAGSWTNLGIVTQTSPANDYNAIDPNLFVDSSGRWWLTFGSFWSGIKMIRIDPATGKQHSGDRTLYSLAQRPANVSGAIEAPFIIQRGGFFYLFVSFDFCCRGTSSTYRVMVGRSTSVTGPYVDRNGAALTRGGGTEVVATHGAIVGPGHEALIADTDGWLMAYHYYTPTDSRLGLNHVGWSDGWPSLF
ncbi:MAG TPA: arabinan endo-1,5-alpha-L-arabinosidase [Streptosporangiaceae bacterium]|nr:arabinan endo-1,5-alpha-L-arabinosidase [Streptosporangiaceae bacterium]